MQPSSLSHQLFTRAATHAATFRDSLAERPVHAAKSYPEVRAGFRRPLAEAGRPASDVIDELIAVADPGIVASAGPRYFGFVVGGALPAATAAEILAAGWDQNAWNSVLSPTSAAAEQASADWLKELLGLPPTASAGFATGAQSANTIALAAARHHVLHQAGWDVEADGLGSAPKVRLLAGEERHATIDRSLRLLGFGSRSLELVPSDSNGALDLDALRARLTGHTGPLIVCLQAGNVNTAPRTHSAPPATSSTSTAAGFTSTAPSVCGLRPAPRSTSRSAAWNARTPGPATATSG